MADQDYLRDWHRLFGLLLSDFFADSPFTVELERDLSQQQQFLDVVILRRRRGRVTLRLPDGLGDLVDHNLITFKSHHETLDPWAMKELLGHYVAYRKLVSTSTSALLPEERFRLYAVCARFPEQLSKQTSWREEQAGVYHCKWGVDTIRVIVAGQLPLEPHNAALHLFSAAPDLVGFGQREYRQRCPATSAVLGQLFERFHGEGFAMPYTMEDFTRDYVKEHFSKLPANERRDILESLPANERRDILESLPVKEQEELLQSMPLERRLTGLSAEQIRDYLDRLSARTEANARKPGRSRPRRRR